MYIIFWIYTDVEIYFDNKIGIIVPEEKEDKSKSKVKGSTNGTDDKKYKYDILKVIEKRNQEEEEIAELIKQFEEKIDRFFDYIKTDSDGLRLIAKIEAGANAFGQEEIYSDFDKIYRKFIRRNKDIGEFFIKETKTNTTQLCDDFERSIYKMYKIQEPNVTKAAEDDVEYNKD